MKSSSSVWSVRVWENVRCAVPVWCLWRLPQRSCADWAAELNCCSLEPAQTYPQTCRGGGLGKFEKEREKMWKRMSEWERAKYAVWNNGIEWLKKKQKTDIIWEASSEFHSWGFCCLLSLQQICSESYRATTRNWSICFSVRGWLGSHTFSSSFSSSRPSSSPDKPTPTDHIHYRTLL